MTFYRAKFNVWANEIFILPTIRIVRNHPIYSLRNLSIEFHWIVFHARVMWMEKEDGGKG